MDIDEDECGSAIYEIIVEQDEPVNHECWEPKGHEGPHRCVACSEQW
jgi:hypothetical protein